MNIEDVYLSERDIFIFYFLHSCKNGLCAHINHSIQHSNTLKFLRNSLCICEENYGLFYILQMQGG